MSLQSGTIYGLCGINGSGKTMLMRALCGLITIDSGEIWIDSRQLGKDLSFPPEVGALIETPGFIGNYSAYHNLKIIADIQSHIGRTEIEQAIIRVGLDPNDRKPYKKYSLGMKQRVGIACAIMERPQLLVLDEPFNAIDEDSIPKIKEIILEEKKRGALVVLACHNSKDMSDVADTIFFLKGGRLCESI